MYFDEKVVDLRERQSPLSTTASVVRGLTAFAAVTSGNIKVTASILNVAFFPALPLQMHFLLGGGVVGGWNAY